MNGLSIDRFEVLGKAGEGGMGTVYVARDRETGERVALKVLLPRGRGDVERFEREAGVLASLRHPAVVGYRGHGLCGDGRPYLAMEWLDGEDLAKRLLRGPLGIEETRALALRIADALGEAHRQGIVHRDVKPSNVLLVDGDVAKARVLDFGVARLSGGAAMTGTGVVMGTPAYMAPEQARGSRDLGPPADVFALGAVLHECLTGAPAFAGDNVMAILSRVLLEPSQAPSEVAAVPPDLDRLVLAMLSKDPAARPADGHAVVHALGLGLEGSSSRVPPPATAFGNAEREWVTLVFARDPEHQDTGNAATLAAGEEDTLGRVAGKVRSLGADLVRLIDGTVVAALPRRGSPKDHAVIAAKCALALGATLGSTARVVVATGRGVRGARAPLGEVIDVAARLLALPAAPSGPRIDGATASLLDAGFELAGDEDSLTLAGEHTHDEVPRMLLGKPAPFVGRDREVATVMGLVEEALSEGFARAILLTAPAGTGKSRLRREVLARLLQRGDVPAPIIARGDAMSAGSPNGMLVKLLGSAAGLRDGEAAEVTRQKLVSRVDQCLAGREARRVAAFFAEVVGAPFEGDVVPELVGARLDPTAMGDQLQAAWEDFLSAETQRGPLLLVLEDLHWGDPASAKACDRALRRLRDRRLVVLATARPEVHTAFPGLWAGRDVHEVALVPLSQRASERFVRTVLGDDASDDAVRRITSRAEGNAFVLEELLRAHAAGHGEALPETALALTAARFSALPDDVRRVLRAASVFGETFWQASLEALSVGADVAACLTALVDAEIVEAAVTSRFQGERELQFRHALLRDGAYATLTDADARLGHAHAARWLEAHGEREPAVLAEHHDRAGDARSAARHHLRAAEHALEGNDLEGAIRHGAAALGGDDPSLDLAHAYEILADAHQSRAEFPEAIVAGRRAMELSPEGGARWFRAALSVGIALQRTGAFEELVALLLAVVDVAPREGAGTARLETLARFGIRCFYYGNVEVARRAFEAAERTVAEGPIADAWRLVVAAGRAASRGDLPTFLDHLGDAGDRLAAAGKLRDALSQWEDRCWWQMNIGETDEGLALTERLLAEAQRIGLRRLDGHLRLALTWGLGRVGRVDEGLATIAPVVRETVGREQHAVRLHRLWLLVENERWDEALAEIALVDREQLVPSYAVQLDAGSARVHAALGARERYETDSRRVLASELAGNAFMHIEALAWVASAQLAMGDEAEARLTVERGVTLVEASLRGFSDLDRRARTMRTAKGIASIVQLAGELGLRPPFG